MNYDTKNCFSRLPCGICMLTNKTCPFAEGSNYEVTCETSPTNVIDKYKVDYGHTESTTGAEVDK